MGEGDTDTDKKSKPLTKAQRAIVNAGTEIRLDRATAEDAAYLARQFVQAHLAAIATPRRTPSTAS